MCVCVCLIFLGMTIDVFRAHGLLYVIEFYVQLYIHIYIYVCVSLMGFINQLKTALYIIIIYIYIYRAPPLYFAGWVEATVEPANQQGLVSR